VPSASRPPGWWASNRTVTIRICAHSSAPNAMGKKPTKSRLNSRPLHTDAKHGRELICRTRSHRSQRQGDHWQSSPPLVIAVEAGRKARLFAMERRGYVQRRRSREFCVKTNRPKGAWSLRVALRSQPVYPARSRQPFINVGFALKPLDVPGFFSRVLRQDLPIVLSNPLHFEGDSRFCHNAEYALSGPSRKPYSGLPYSKDVSIQAAVVGSFQLAPIHTNWVHNSGCAINGLSINASS
jgi:hypothetical protein